MHHCFKGFNCVLIGGNWGRWLTCSEGTGTASNIGDFKALLQTPSHKPLYLEFDSKCQLSYSLI